MPCSDPDAGARGAPRIGRIPPLDRSASAPTHRLYDLFLAAGSTLTVVTLPLATPGALILLTAVIGFIGTVIYTWGLVALNYSYLPSLAPETAPRGGLGRTLLVLCAATYTLLAILYLYALLLR